MPRLELSLILAFFCYACTGDQTSGVAGVASIEELPVYALAEELRIGSVDDPDYGFSRVGDVAVDAEGFVYVFEALDAEIRVYSPDGRLHRRFGRKGRGPGEFTGRMLTLGVGDDTVWAFDWSARRLTLFDRRGNLLNASRVDDVEVGKETTGLRVLAGPAWRDREGHFVGERNPASILELFTGAIDSVKLPHVRFSGDGRVVDTVGWYTEPIRRHEPRILPVGNSKYVIPEPYSHDPLITTTAQGRIYVHRPLAPSSATSFFTVTSVTFDGDTVFRRDYAYSPVGYPDVALDSIAARAARATGTMRVYSANGSGIDLTATGEDSARARVALRQKLAFPEYQPPILGYRIGDDGSIWLRREDTGTSMHRWLILDRNGDGIGHVDLPKSKFRLAWVSGDALLAIQTDSLDIPWLVRYRLTH